MLGRTLSHYKVLEEISRGRMGIVYKAMDLKLKREVALKVLPRELVSDPERKRRFVQEAQAAAALKHPNIGVVYEIDDEDGVDFIAMELIEGEALADVVKRGALPVERVLHIGVQVIEGLAHAHEGGIVHRDVKPGNILMDKNGHIKIIDFGLAKLLEPAKSADADSDIETAIRAQTQAGQVMGTVAYMSPEQARAQNVDHRSDIFSFGVVLFELLTGKLPFQGASGVETLNMILNDPAPPLPGDPELQRIVHRCLEKDAEDRYQSAKDLLSELRRFSHSDSQLTTAVTAQPANGALVVIGMGVLAALFVGGLFLLPRVDTTFKVPRLLNPRQITFDAGAESNPSTSEDGGLVAYESSQSGSPDIWLTQLGGGESINRTSDHQPADFSPTVSPDGSRIAFLSLRDGGMGTFVMPTLAGRPRKVAHSGPTIFYSRAQWSRDGARLAYVVSDADRFYVETRTLPSGEPRRVVLAGRKQGRFDLSWSPDERFVAYVDAPGFHAQVTQLWLLRLEDGEVVPLTDGQANDWTPSWSPDGRAIYFVSNRGGSSDLWVQRVDRDGKLVGEAEPLTSGVGMRKASLSVDGTKLVYAQGRRITNLWRVPIRPDRPANWSDAEQLTFDQSAIDCVDLSPDRTRLAFSSDRGGHHNIWTMPAEGGPMEQLTFEVMPDWCPSYSPDGKELLIYSFRDKSRDIWTLPASGGQPKQISHQAGDAQFPMWSPDGMRIAYHSNQGGNEDIWTMSVEGDDIRQLTNDASPDLFPIWSPEGEWLLFSSRRDPNGQSRIWRVPSNGGTPEPVTDANGTRPRYSLDGSRIYFRDGKRVRFVEHIFADGSEKTVADFSGKRGHLSTFALATDDQYLYFGWEEDLGDIWVMDVVRDESE